MFLKPFTILALASCSVFAATCSNEFDASLVKAYNIVSLSTSPIAPNNKITSTMSANPGQVVIVDNCNFNVTGLSLRVQLLNGTDPKIRWYGKVTLTGESFPLTDKAMSFNGGPNITEPFAISFSPNDNFPLTTGGGKVGGVSFKMFDQFVIYSETYSWVIASANLPIIGGATTGTTAPPPPANGLPAKGTSSAGRGIVGGVVFFVVLFAAGL